MVLPFFGKPLKPTTPQLDSLTKKYVCNEPGPARRQLCWVGKSSMTDPACSGCSQKYKHEGYQ